MAKTNLLLVVFSIIALCQSAYAQSTRDSSLDLFWSGTKGLISLPKIAFGSSLDVTFQVSVLHRGTTAGCALRFGEVRNAADYIQVRVNGFLKVQVGQTTVTSNEAFPVDEWVQLTVSISNKVVNGVQRGVVTAFFGKSQVTFASNVVDPITGAERIGFLGSCLDGSYFNGLVDDLRIWSVPFDSAKVEATYEMGLADLLSTGLIAHFPMNEGANSWIGGVSGFDADRFYTAKASGGFAWTRRARVGTKKCHSTGDPHLAPWQGNNYDPPHVAGHFLLVQCSREGSGEIVFESRTRHEQGCCWGRNTVNDAVTVKHYDTIFLIARGREYYKRQVTETEWTQVHTSPANQQLESGMILVFGSSHVVAYGPPFGYIQVNDATNYLNIYLGITEECNSQIGLCKNQVFNLNSWQFYFDDQTIPDTPLLDIPPRNNDPCANAPSVVQDAAELTCNRLFPDKVKYADEYGNCKFDICASGDVTIVLDNTQEEACYLAQLRGDPDALETDCELKCDCSGLGECNAEGVCVCDAGWTGPNCRSPASIEYFTFESDYYNETVIQSNPISGPNFPQTYDVSHLISASYYQIPSSVLFWIAKVENTVSQTHGHHLYIVNNHNSELLGGGYTLKAQYTGFTSPQVEVFSTGNGASNAPAGDPQTLNFAWSLGSTHNAIVRNLPEDWCIDFTIENPNGLEQVLIGSGSNWRTLDTFKVPTNDWNKFKICGEKLPNPCASITNCKDCAANPKCGWCRDTQVCSLGAQGGPTDGSVCRNWRFSFEDYISRRLEAKFSYPVNPDETQVFLVSQPTGNPDELATLPLDVTVDMGREETSVWDLLLTIPTAPHNTVDRDGIANNIQNILTSLSRFTNLGFGIASYSSPTTPSHAYRMLKALESPKNDKNNFLSVVNGLTFNSAATGKLSVLNALKLASSTQHPNWRSNSRRMIFIIADSTYGTLASEGFASVAEAKKAMLTANVLPVFAVTPAVKSEYVNLVRQLGFGLVIDHTAGSSEITTEIGRALRRAGGAISLVVDDDHVGHIDTGKFDTNIMNMFGLVKGMRAKFVYPMGYSDGEIDTSVLIAPGYGFATVSNILSDKPTATGVDVYAVEDQILEPYSDTIRGIIVSLDGRPFDLNGAVVAKVISVPALGKLYQFDEAGPSELINNGDYVTDKLHRTIYIPEENGHSEGDEPYTTLTYIVEDACTGSLPKEIGIHLASVNDPPVAGPMPTVVSFEDQPTVITLVGSDVEGHVLGGIITQSPFDVDVLGNKINGGSFYQYTDAIFAQLQADYKNTAGAVLIDTTSGPVAVTDSNMRVIFVSKEHHNSDYRPASMYSFPRFAYRVKELSHNEGDPADFVLLSSAEAIVDIKIFARNDAPSVEIPDFDYDKLLEEGTCFTGPCEYEQNFGGHYSDIINPVMIYVGGSDIESVVLSARITAVDCPATAMLRNEHTKNRLAVGDIVSGIPNNGISAAVGFRPGLDEFSSPAGSVYCSFSYVILDDEAMPSGDSRKLDIIIHQINQLPRIDLDQRLNFVANRRESLSFSISAYDPEGDEFDAILTSCVPDIELHGKLFYINGDNQAVEIDCNGVEGTVHNMGARPVNADGRQVYRFIWEAPAERPELASAYTQFVQVLFDDHNDHPNAGENKFYVYLDVNNINQNPLLELNEQVGEIVTKSYTIVAGGSTSLSSQLKDDAGENNIKIVIHIYGAFEGETNFDFPVPRADFTSGGVQIVATYPPEAVNIPGFYFDTSDGFIETQINYQFANDVLNSLQFNSASFVSATETEPVNRPFVVEVRVSDEGNIGACDPTNPEACAKFAVAFFYVNVVEESNTNATVAGAAAAAGLAAAAAIGLGIWKKLRKPTDDGFQPWSFDDNEDFSNSNPLFEKTNNEHSNPLFENPSNKS